MTKDSDSPLSNQLFSVVNLRHRSEPKGLTVGLADVNFAPGVLTRDWRVCRTTDGEALYVMPPAWRPSREGGKWREIVTLEDPLRSQVKDGVREAFLNSADREDSRSV